MATRLKKAQGVFFKQNQRNLRLRYILPRSGLGLSNNEPRSWVYESLINRSLSAFCVLLVTEVEISR